jgi:hypothetical protein
MLEVTGNRLLDFAINQLQSHRRKGPHFKLIFTDAPNHHSNSGIIIFDRIPGKPCLYQLIFPKNFHDRLQTSEKLNLEFSRALVTYLNHPEKMRTLPKMHDLGSERSQTALVVETVPGGFDVLLNTTRRELRFAAIRVRQGAEDFSTHVADVVNYVTALVGENMEAPTRTITLVAKGPPRFLPAV